MPRTRRYIFDTLTAMSVLLLLATVGLWVDSCWYSCGVSYSSTDGYLALVSRRHLIRAHMDDKGGGPFRGWQNWHKSAETQPPLLDDFFDPQVLGFGLRWREKHVLTNITTFIILPHWFLALVLAVLPGVWYIKWRRRRNQPDNPCLSCGYDLSGNETGECPECGVAFTFAK